MIFGTFIFVHDQQIILDFERINKFNGLENLTYVFLGKNQTDLIEDKKNVFICKNQIHNLEDFPRLTSFTGWFAIWKSEIYKKYDVINLFEYDVNLSKNFTEIIKENSNNNVISYIEIGVHDRNFLKTPKWSDVLLNSLNKKYGRDVMGLFNKIPRHQTCGITSNHTMNNNAFEKYMSWIDPMIDDLKNSPLSGHQVERSIPAFYLLENIQYKLIKDVLFHFQLDSHGTQYRNSDKYIQQYPSLLS
jgi:hypothetical protein